MAKLGFERFFFFFLSFLFRVELLYSIHKRIREFGVQVSVNFGLSEIITGSKIYMQLT